MVQQMYGLEMVIDIFVGCFCIHDQNPCAWLVFDNSRTCLKREQLYIYISKMNEWMIYDPYLLKAIIDLSPKFVRSFGM